MDTLRSYADRSCSTGDSGIENCSGTSAESFANPSIIDGHSEATVADVDLNEDTIDDTKEIDSKLDYGQHNAESNPVSLDSGSAFEMLNFQSCDKNSAWEFDSSSCHARPTSLTSDKIPFDECNASEDGRRHSTGKLHEVDVQEERDSFSPVSTGYSSDQPLDEPGSSFGFIQDHDESPTTNATELDNKVYSKRKNNPTSTKEEKQRQNEEIVIMETSSISSETGSWESVFPHRTNPEVKDCCDIFIQNERQNCFRTGQDFVLQATETIGKNIFAPVPSSSTGTACFIDASTLLDEPEIVYSTSQPVATSSQQKVGPNERMTNPDKTDWQKKLKLDKLESFHKSFEMCKSGKPIPKATDSSSSSSGESPQKALPPTEESTNNLSDEEKLWKRENSKKNSRIEVKDQYVKESPDSYQDILKKTLHSMDAAAAHKDVFHDRDKDDVVRSRMDNERKQGNLIFQNSIQHFSGHAINPIIPFAENNFDDSQSHHSASEKDFSREQYATETNSLCEFGDESYNEVDFKPPSNQDETSDSCFLPQTPHNSIVQIGNDRTRYNSTSNAEETSEISCPIKIPKRSTKCDDFMPIVSGGVSVEDFTPKQCESPPVRRKTDTCPIVSGGFSSLDYKFEDDEKTKVKERSKMSQSITSWVVDMSDCSKNQRNSSTSSSSAENTSRSVEEASSSARSVKNGLGFYVSLNDLEPTEKNEQEVERPRKMSNSLFENVKKSTGFYVDLSEGETSATETPPSSINSHTTPQSAGADKRNIFSMFIDFGSKKLTPKRELALSSLHLISNSHSKKDQLTTNSPRTTSHNSSARKKLDYKLESDDECADKIKPYEARETHSNDVSLNIIEKHEESDIKHDSNNSDSGSPSKEDGEKLIDLPVEEVKAHSEEAMSFKHEIPPVDVMVSPLESEISNYSIKSSSNASTSAQATADEDNAIATGTKRHRCDVKINETFDKSSQDSLTDGILSKDLSPVSTGTETGGDDTFQHDNIVSDTPCSKETDKTPVMEVIDELKELTLPSHEDTFISSKSRPRTSGTRSAPGQESSPTHTMETLHATIEKQKQLLETVNEHAEISTNFVKLSDMDKPITKFELHSPEAVMSKSVGSHRNITRLFQENRARPHSWIMTRSTGNNLMNITSSVENLKSLTRLFPHLSKELSNSVPSNVSLDMANAMSSDNNERIQSDVSGESSLTSSISRSAMDESSISSRQPRRLGEDLLKMFLQELGTDVTVEVNGRRIKAHKCILRSRCQYFAAILAGGWVESAGNVISLSGYSYSAVHFALCHIYSGASHPPEGISLMELAALADLLGLEGLKEVTAHALKINYCHNFHRPCNGCIDGNLQVLPVALNHALDDLYRKCLKWTCRHYMKVWPTRSFAHLPNDILARCRQQIVAHLTSETVLETILDCNQLIMQLAPCRWAVAIENIVRDILDAAHAYVSDHFATLIASDSFLSLGHDKSTHIPRLESLLLRVASTLSPDQACRSYQRVTRLNSVLAAKVIKVPSEHHSEFIDDDEEEEMDWNEEFIRFVSAILSAVEQCLTRQCARAMRASAWQRMELELRKKIQKLACLTEPLDLRRSKSMTKQMPFNTNNRNHDLYQVKLAIRAHSKRIQSQDNDQPKTTSHTQTTHANNRNIQTIEKGVQANNEVDVRNDKISKSSSRTTISSQNKVKPQDNGVSVSRRNQSQNSSFSRTTKPVVTQQPTSASSTRLSSVRSRYLEPKKTNGPVKSDSRTNIANAKNKQISSTESSKTSSPVTGKTTNKVRTLSSKSMNVSVDSLASPARNNGKLKGKIDMEISIDSLADSMQSNSTDKTVSQESLVRHDINVRKEHLVITKNASMSNVPMSRERQNARLFANTRVTRTKSLSCQTSGSTPSSVTNKSSRLSSTTSSVDSPRDKSRNSSIANAGQTLGTQRASFLSARSREILARKAAATANGNQNNVNGSKAVATVKTEKVMPNPINKSSSSSNIPKRRPLQPTTLHLRKTAKVIPNVSVTVTNNTNKLIVTANNGAGNTSKYNSSIKKFTKPDKTIEKVLDNKKSVLNEKNEIIGDISPSEIQDSRIESKLERSSTFCKEVSDFPATELKIIE